ncbi:MAG: hypothetical protein J6A75_13635 [Lachnospiraceae bacterium]|nr:hypothetical protein [Lachnospiraceae bacterium]
MSKENYEIIASCKRTYKKRGEEWNDNIYYYRNKENGKYFVHFEDGLYGEDNLQEISIRKIAVDLAVEKELCEISGVDCEITKELAEKYRYEVEVYNALLTGYIRVVTDEYSEICADVYGDIVYFCNEEELLNESPVEFIKKVGLSLIAHEIAETLGENPFVEEGVKSSRLLHIEEKMEENREMVNLLLGSRL